MNIELNTSWIAGNYINGEINTQLSYVSVNDPEFFSQGEQAETIIKKIHEIWLNTSLTNEEAFNRWINLYL